MFVTIRSIMIAALLFGTGVTLQAQHLPNIIYIYADDLGYGELGCYGQRLIETPNIDKLAAEGMRFTQHYAGAPVCAPSRCMLLTGMAPGRSYIRGNYELGGYADSLEGGQMPLPPGIFTAGHLLKQAGYATAAVGKWGMGMVNNSGHPLQQGFDYFYGYLDQKQAHNHYPTHLWENEHWDTLRNPPMNVHPRPDTNTVSQATYAAYTGKDYAAEKMTAKALQFMQQHRQQPFFLYLAYPQPHASLQVPEEYVNRYKGRFSEQPYKGQQGYTPVQYPASTHAGMISFLDDQVGIIMQQLATLGLDGNTLVFFSSDNGPSSEGGVDPAFFNGSGGLRGGKRDLFEGGIRVPFIARWKGRIPAGTESHLASAQYDLPATFADLTGQRIPDTDGITLLPELLRYRGMVPRHEYFYFEFPEKGGQLAVIKGNMKGVKLDLRQHPDNPWIIFDLSIDPGEQHNIAAQHPDLVKEFNAIVQKEHRHPHIREWEFVDPKITGKTGD